MQDFNQKEMNETIVTALLREQRITRRWRNIRFVMWFLLISVIVYNVFSATSDKPVASSLLNKKYVALVRINGMIAPDSDASAENLVPALRRAFSDKKAEGVILEINSPGGTPVQAAIIHDAILAYKKKYKKKVVVVGEDLLTSGAYYVSVAADSIYVNSNTITGSVGVIMKGFGFVDLIKKVGIERRVYTAGKNKDRLDPFLPQTEADQEKIREVMSDIHKNFADAVIEGRKGKLVGKPEDLFTGDFWPGNRAVALGLVDGTGNFMDVAEKEFGTTRFIEYGDNYPFFHLFSSHMHTAFNKLAYL